MVDIAQDEIQAILQRVRARVGHGRPTASSAAPLVTPGSRAPAVSTLVGDGIYRDAQLGLDLHLREQTP